MSVRLVTTPWLTKNLAGGGLDTRRLLGGRRDGRGDGTARASRDDPISARGTPGSRRPAAYHPRACCSPSTSATRTSRVGLFRAGALLATRRAATNARATTDEVELLLDGLLAARRRSPRRRRRDRARLGRAGADRRRRGRSPSGAIARCSIAAAGTVPLAVRVDRPGEVGADRLVNALAAARLYGTPAVVVDFGTATTLDCVAADGAYVGGAIAPGLELGLEALAARTAKLPRIELRAPDRAIGRDTVSAMQSGTIFGYQALAAGLLARVRRELADANDVAPAEVRAILTGGLSAAPWARALEGIDAIDPDLTLKGLAILHAEVGGGEPLELGLA